MPIHATVKIYGLMFLVVVVATLLTKLPGLALGFAPLITFVPAITFSVA